MKYILLPRERLTSGTPYNMKKMYEELETSEELKARGLQQIKRRFHPKKDEMTLKDCWVKSEISLNPDVLKFYNSDSKKINAVLRDVMEKKKLSQELLADTEFVRRLREKLAAVGNDR